MSYFYDMLKDLKIYRSDNMRDCRPSVKNVTCGAYRETNENMKFM